MTTTETAEEASERILPAAGITFAAGTGAGVAAAAVGATPGHAAIVASLTAALTVAGEVTSRTRRARITDGRLAVKTLHTLIRELRPFASELSEEWSKTLAIVGNDLEVILTLEFRRGDAGAISEAFAFIDRTWRLAGLVARGDSDLLPARGKFDLDELAPQRDEGLVVIDAKIGSFTAKLRTHKARLLHVVVFLLINGPAMSGYSARDLPDLIHGDGVTSPPQQQVCTLHISGEIHEPVRKLIRRELGGLPVDDCTVTVNVTTTEGARLRFSFTDTRPSHALGERQS